MSASTATRSASASWSGCCSSRSSTTGRRAGLTRDDYKSPIPEHLRWRNWAADPEGMTGDALLDFVNNSSSPSSRTCRADPVRNPRGFVVRGVFEDAYNYMKSGQLLRQVINKINGIDFNRQAERHQFGDLYEQILRDLQSAGNAGEFYTPRAVTQFMVDMVDPSWARRCSTRPAAPAASSPAPSSTCASR
jgi:type I restriction enzyme M protein